MATTTRLVITKLEEGQRQKEVTLNTALDALDAAAYKVQYRGVKASLPAAAANTNALAIVTDGTPSPAGTWLVYSNGTNWIYMSAVNGTTLT